MNTPVEKTVRPQPPLGTRRVVLLCSPWFGATVLFMASLVWPVWCPDPIPALLFLSLILYPVGVVLWLLFRRRCADCGAILQLRDVPWKEGRYGRRYYDCPKCQTTWAAGTVERSSDG
jgi:hypothetical protein